MRSHVIAVEHVVNPEAELTMLVRGIARIPAGEKVRLRPICRCIRWGLHTPGEIGSRERRCPFSLFIRHAARELHFAEGAFPSDLFFCTPRLWILPCHPPIVRESMFALNLIGQLKSGIAEILIGILILCSRFVQRCRNIVLDIHMEQRCFPCMCTMGFLPADFIVDAGLGL